ncbi:acetylglutamate kinase [Clostridiaceae bacterium UIB06]|uniref:Acetylglutamate kinase n=1 Tax=Clostridium thailandense TaxID=2794346 RepID=A0A949TKC7_9CLOT|nr:acetylglutamate kinase [Clostridium thailandense]MBV7274449.1 acetylglutamate kinase [Clostridium thailandense]MCH5136635.1 acetylglutamate kinase [Clostridiaceae bacterium UIB06]
MLEETIPLELEQDIEKFKGKTFVIKYGGSIMNNENASRAFIEDVVLLKRLGINIVIIHGGGPEISKWLQMTGIKSEFRNGLRVTDENVMDVAEMVLSGHINKDISANLSSQGVSAIGLSGRDSNLIKAKKKYLYENGRKIDIGFVGDVVSINKSFLLSILEKDRVPVISPIACDSHGNKYNINADYAASFISAELKAEKLIILTDVEGVYKDINDKSSLIKNIEADDVKHYIHEGIIKGGMIPKMECCIEAVENGAKNIHLIDGRKKHSLVLNLAYNSGTKIISKGRVRKCQKVI